MHKFNCAVVVDDVFLLVNQVPCLVHRAEAPVSQLPKLVFQQNGLAGLDVVIKIANNCMRAEIKAF